MKLTGLNAVRQVRLLPVVICAGAALLTLKGVGIITGGGYVLTGPLLVQAAGATAPTMATPHEPTIDDESPTLDDGVPTLPLRETAAVAGGHGETGAEADAATGLDFLDTAAPPVIRDSAGNDINTDVDGMTESANQILERLALRRDELEQREAELDMRLALVEAAEKRMDERTAALQALETRINAMVDEKRSLEEAQFVAVVTTYETMKPKDAAAILDQLELGVLVRVARAIAPRKLAPIMARMDPLRAKDLTANLAVDQVEPTIEVGRTAGVAELPQIVGQ